MKNKISFVGLVCLFLFSFAMAEEKFGFTGEFYQIPLKRFPISLTDRFEVEDEIELDLRRKSIAPVKALMVGVCKWEPDDPESESFYFWSYHFPGISEWWIGFFAANYGNKTVPCNVIMQLKGPKKSKITRKATLQPNQATLFKAKINLASKVGMYTAIGKLSGEEIGAGKKVTTRFYIYEVW